MTRIPFVVLSLTLLPGFGSLPATLSCTNGNQEQGTRYHCPMHPTYVSDRPGDCPICGMRLVPVEKPHPDTPAPIDAPASGTGSQAERPLGTWVCPMTECGTVSHHPGRCPKCGMDLVPVPEGGLLPGQDPSAARNPTAAPPDMAEVQVTGDGRQVLGVQTVVATRGRLDRTVRALGHVTADETRIHQVHVKTAGYVERLYVNQTGQEVRRGSPLLDLYSPELLASQEDFLRALQAARRFQDSRIPEVRAGGRDLLEAARRRLELFDVPASFLRHLERTGVPRRTVTLRAPASGVVTLKGVFEGQRISPETEVMTITDLSRVWIEADLYEDEAKGIAVGQPVTASLSYDPAVRLTGRVTFLHPTLAPGTRTMKVRLEFPNPDGTLRPGAFTNVQVVLESGEGVLIPDTAVMDTGTRAIVFVTTDDHRFVPREVTVALRDGGMALVAEGLAEGERVASAATFLLDSESRIRSAVQGPATRPSSSSTNHQGHGQ